MTDVSLLFVAKKYRCQQCDYSTSHKCNWTKHLSTRKHKILTNTDAFATKSSETYLCVCGRSYRHRQSLFSHKKNCKTNLGEKSIVTCGEDVDNLSKADLLNVIKEMIPKIGNTTTNIESTTNNINIQLFLDKECKDAMTIQGFADQLSLTVGDLLKGNKPMAIAGVSNIVIENLRPIPLTERPMHCTDVEKRKWHVKDAIEGWKEEDGESVINQAEFNVCNKFQILWDKTYPGWQNNETLKQQYTDLVIAINSNPSPKEIEKALKRIGPECKLTSADIAALVKPENGII